MTDYKWEIKECAEQKEIFMMYLRERSRKSNSSHAETFEALRAFRIKQKKVRTFCSSIRILLIISVSLGNIANSHRTWNRTKDLETIIL